MLIRLRSVLTFSSVDNFFGLEEKSPDSKTELRLVALLSGIQIRSGFTDLHDFPNSDVSSSLRLLASLWAARRRGINLEPFS